MAQGTVKWFNARKGYGFIESEGRSVFAHRKDFLESHLVLHHGQAVTFELQEGEKGLQAVQLSVCAEKASSIMIETKESFSS